MVVSSVGEKIFCFPGRYLILNSSLSYMYAELRHLNYMPALKAGVDEGALDVENTIIMCRALIR